MAATNVADYFKLKIRINHPKGGWTESFNMVTEGITPLKARATRLISARADVLAKNLQIPYANISKEPTPKGDSYLPRGYRFAPINLATEAAITDVATANDFEVGPLWRYDTNDGKFVNRLIRGLRDAQIVNNAAIYTTATVDSMGTCDIYTGATAGVTTHNNALKMLLSMIFHYTVHIKTFEAPDVAGFTQRTFQSMQYRKISSRDGGQRYGAGRGRQAAWA